MNDKDLQAIPKSSEKITRPGKGWVTKKQLADFLDITPRCFDRDYRRYADDSAVREVNRTLFFHARSILNNWKATGGRGPHPAQEGETDALMLGPESDALEFYRKQRGLQEEIKLEQMRGNTVAVADIEPPLLNLCGMLRRAGETLARQFGNDAAQVLNEAVEEFEKGCETVLKLEVKGVTE